MQGVSHEFVLAMENFFVTRNDMLGILVKQARRSAVEVHVALDCVCVMVDCAH